MYLYLKALHIIGVVTWFAGLFYIVRLFVYLTEAHERPEAERDVLLPQLQLMARRLWFGITWPSCIATVIFGGALLHTWWPPPTWLQVKLVGVVGLLAYHGSCHWLHARLQAGEPPWTSRSLRIWNEVATLFLVGIVFLVVVKDGLSLVYGTVGLLIFTAVLMAGITAYRRVRMRSQESGR
ncbi:MAG: CopD family protein [Alphaproteobacteria bacterium]|nr:CopD family protein [Alphaproteobacteria bacterium]